MGEKIKKDLEIDDIEASIAGNIGLSPLERIYTMIETARTVSDIQNIAMELSPMLRGLKDKDGNLIYYDDDPKSPEAKEMRMDYPKMINLYEKFNSVYKAHGQEHISISFKEEGVKGKVGDSFSIVAPHDDAAFVIAAVDKEGDKQDMAVAQAAITPLLGLLGKHGLVDPRRKMNIAGKIGEMMDAIDEDVSVLEALERERKRDMDHFKKELETDYKNLKGDIGDIQPSKTRVLLDDIKKTTGDE